MEQQFIEIGEEEWFNTYKPLANHLDDNASFQTEEGIGYMFETYGEELDFVRAQNPLHIWTYTHGDNNSGYISNGYSLVNRLGYFVTELPAPENTWVQICIQEPNYLCANCEEQWEGEEVVELHYDKFSELGTDGKCAACATPEELAMIGEK